MANNETLGKREESVSLQKDNAAKNFFQKNQKVIYGVLVGVLVVIAAAFAFYKFYATPRAERASEAMYATIQSVCMNGMMANDSLTLATALNGNEEIEGFVAIMDNYSGTDAANTAKYWAALCYLALDDKESALEQLLNFKKEEDYMWYNAQMLIGDLYDDENDVAEAAKYYKSAIKGETASVAPIALWKLGLLAEREGNWAEALNCYQQIKDNYYERYTQMGVDKYYERAKMSAK